MTDVYTALQTDPHVHYMGAEVEVGSVHTFYEQHRHVQVQFVAITHSLPIQLPTAIWYVTLWSVAHTP